MNRITHFVALRKPFSFIVFSNSLLSARQNTSSSLSSELDTGSTSHPKLTPDELKKVNLLLPRLCESNHLHEAIRLIDTVLLTNPPLNSLSLPVLIDRLAEEPNMTQTMSLLNRLKHNPTTHSSLLHINKLLINSYLKKQKFREVVKILSWISRPDSPCVSDKILYRIVVKGLCRNHKTVEALGVVKKMVEGKVEVGSDLRNWVYMSLLWEARVLEAKEFNEAWGEGGEHDLHKVVALLDRMINNWTE